MMTSIHDVLAEYAQVAPDARTRARLFERLTNAFLTMDSSRVMAHLGFMARRGKGATL